MLPKPKAFLSKSNKADIERASISLPTSKTTQLHSKLLPPSLMRPLTKQTGSNPAQKRHIVEEVEEDSDDESDILGLTLKMPRVEVPASSGPIAKQSTTTVFYDQDDEYVGPSRPAPKEMKDESQLLDKRLNTISYEVTYIALYY